MCCVVSQHGQDMKSDCMDSVLSLGTLPSPCSGRDGTRSLTKDFKENGWIRARAVVGRMLV